MGIFDFFTGDFINPERTRKFTQKAYHRAFSYHNNASTDNFVVHAVALAETLKKWCNSFNEHYINEEIDLEVIPFILMSQDKALEVLPEYILFRSNIEGYDWILLRSEINRVFKKNPDQLQNWKDRKHLRFRWYQLLDPEIEKKMFS